MVGKDGEARGYYAESGAWVAVYTCCGCGGQFDSARDGAHGDDERFFCHGCWNTDGGNGVKGMREDLLTRALERVSARWKLSLEPEKEESSSAPPSLADGLPPQKEAHAPAVLAHVSQAVGDTSGLGIDSELFPRRSEDNAASNDGNGLDQASDCAFDDAESPHARQQTDAVQESGGYPEPRDLFADGAMDVPYYSGPAASPSLYEAASENDFTTVEHLAKNLIRMARNRDAKRVQAFALSLCVPSRFLRDSPAPATAQATIGSDEATEQDKHGSGADAGETVRVERKAVSFAPFVTSVSVGKNGRMQTELVPSNLLCLPPSPGLESAAEAAADARQLLQLLEPLLACATSRAPAPPHQPWSSTRVLGGDRPAGCTRAQTPSVP